MKTNTGMTFTALCSIAIITALMFTMTPSAFATGMSPDLDPTPDPQSPGNPVEIIFTGDTQDAPHKVYLTRVSGADVNPTGADSNSAATQISTCDDTHDLPQTVAADGDMWEFRNTAGTHAIQLNIASTGDIIKFKFGTGGTVSIDVTGGAGTEAVIDDGGGGETVVTEGAWFNITPTGVAADNTDTVGRYIAYACGEDKGGPTDQFLSQEDFDIQEPVGGTILPVSTTSLFIAGLSSSALWILPIAGIAGAGFAVIRSRLSKNQ